MEPVSAGAPTADQSGRFLWRLAQVTSSHAAVRAGASQGRGEVSEHTWHLGVPGGLAFEGAAKLAHGSQASALELLGKARKSFHYNS